MPVSTDDRHQWTARETPSVHQLRNAREMVIILWHEKWTVDGVSCGDYDELREGVCEGGQEGQGAYLRDARINFRGKFDLMHYGWRRRGLWPAVITSTGLET